MVDVEDVAGPRGHAGIERALEIDDDFDPQLVDRSPVGNDGRDEQLAFVVDLDEIGRERIDHAASDRTVIVRCRPVYTVARKTFLHVSIALVVACLSSAGVAFAGEPWPSVLLVGGRSTLLPSLGLAADLPRAMVI